MQMLMVTIIREIEQNPIPQRMSDGYINATAMCNACGRQAGEFGRLASTKAFLAELSRETGIPAALLVVSVKGGDTSLQGTWVHPQVAIILGQWCSPKFAVLVSKWVVEWMSGKVSVALPPHITRYMANRSKIPLTHFSVFNELIFAVIAPLEELGYSVPENMVPDISQGKMFAKWLRDVKGVNTADLPKYLHTYQDQRGTQEAILYPNELLADYKQHLIEEWIPKRMYGYFEERDTTALPYIATMLGLPAPADTPQIKQ